jgi:ferrochelatase
LTPYTDETIEKLARGSVDDLLIMSPAFVSDCLETTEELGIEGKEEFLEAGGESFYLIPCLNDSADWIDVLEKFVDNFRTDQYRENNVANSTEKRAAQ